MLITKQTRTVDMNKDNDFFSQSLDAYIKQLPEPEQLARPDIEEEILTYDFLINSGIDSEELNLNMALCREFEGE